MHSLMMCIDAEDLKTQAGWDGAAGLSRQHLLSELSRTFFSKDFRKKRFTNLHYSCRINFAFCNDS